MEKEYTQVEQELEINSKQEEKIDTSKLDDISSETGHLSNEISVNIVNFITKPAKTIQALSIKDDLFKKKIIKTFLLFLSLCIAIYYYVIILTIPSTVWWEKIILTTILMFFYIGYLYVDALGVWCGSKILGGKGKFIDTFIVTLSIATMYFANEALSYILQLIINSITSQIISFILSICILIFSIKTLSKVQEFSGTRSFFSIILSGILIYIWTLVFSFILIFSIMAITGIFR